jgi:aryl-alcohol dehydrogenase-like predicted oxidoreductase
MADFPKILRRDALQWIPGLLLSATASSSKTPAANNSPVIAKPIGNGREKVPVVGLGTNRFRLDNRDAIRTVLQRMAELGGGVIDTAPAYGESEDTLGQLLSQLPLRHRFFLATKISLSAVTAPNVLSPAASLERSLRRLQTDRIDLLQVHNLQGTAELMPQLLEWRRTGIIRYIGLTTSRTAQHAELIAQMQQHPVDFVQIDYSLGNRVAAESVLPAAARKNIAVLVNLPLGGGRTDNIVKLAGARPLPEWALAAGIGSWAQFGLSYVTSHPAVTCAIPGTTQLTHLEDNQRAARITPLGAALRRKAEEFWDGEVRGMVKSLPAT